MAGASDAISTAFDLYKENYRKVITAFIALLLIAVVISFLSIFISFSLSFTEKVCELSTAQGEDIVSDIVANIICEFTKPSSLINTGLGWITSIFAILIILAVMKPLQEIILAKEKVSDWTAHLSPQISNSIKLFIFEILLGLTSFIPVIAVLFLLVPDIISVLSSTETEYLGGVLLGILLKSLVALMVGLSIGVLLSVVFALLFTFVRVELALENQGLVSAVRNSIELFQDNMIQVLLFHILWLFIGIVVGILTLITCCMAVFVDPIVSYLLVLPVRLMSEIVLWRELKAQRKDSVARDYESIIAG